MEKQSTWLIPALAAIGLFSCTASGQKPKHRAGTAVITMTTTTETVAPQGRETSVATRDIVTDTSKSIGDNISKAKDLTTLSVALRTAQLDSLLAHGKAFTVFAPDNKAFNKLPVGIVDVLIEAREKTALKNILSYHIVSGKYNTSNLRDGMLLTTLQGGKLRISHRKGYWQVNNAKMVEDATASKNGVLWIIDKVMLP